MYPEDIEQLFDLAALGTKVTVVNQPLLYRWHRDSLYVQSYPPHEELRSNNKEAQAEQRHALFNKAISNEIWQRVRQQGGVVDWKVTEQVVNEARGVAVPVSRRGISYDGYLATARRVENTLPEGANWDGSDGEDEPADKASGVGARRTKP